MEFKIHVKDFRADWWESYNKSEVVDQASAEDVGRRMVQYYNDTLKPGERKRTFLESQLTTNSGVHESHEWEKTNLYTVMERGRNFDTAECKKCGVTAKRYGLGEPRLDSQFRAQAFRYCDTARAMLAKRAAKAGRNVSQTTEEG